MKQFIKLSLVSTLTLSSSVFAVNPVQGLYGSLFGEFSNGPANHNLTFTRDGMIFTGTIKNNPLGGGGGGALGYRIQKFRVEGEVIYNRISYDTLNVGTCSILSPNLLTPVGYCPLDGFQRDALGFNGSTAGIYGLVNLYYDFVSYEGESSFVPYVGLGLGGVRIKNSQNFVNTNTVLMYSQGYSDTNTTSAAQGILGISFYLDDYFWMGMDYRYLSSNKLKAYNDSRYAINTLNFNVNFAFDNA